MAESRPSSAGGTSVLPVPSQRQAPGTGETFRQQADAQGASGGRRYRLEGARSAVLLGLAALLVTAVLPVSVLLVAGSWATTDVIERAEAGLRSTASVTAVQLGASYDAARRTVTAAGTRPGLGMALEGEDAALARATLDNMILTAPLAGAGLYDTDGRLLAQSLGQSARPLPPRRSWPDRVVEGPPTASGRDTLRRLSVPVGGPGGARLGTVVADIDLRRVAGPSSGLRLSRTGFVQVVGTDGRVIASGSPASVGGPLRAPVNFRIAQRHEPRQLVAYSVFYRTMVAEAYEPVPGQPWGVLAQEFTSTAFAVAYDLENNLDWLGAGLVVAGTLLAASLAVMIYRRDRRLAGLTTWLDEQVEERTSQLEVANRSMRATSEELEGFTYSVAHDLRTPLRAINAQARILLEEESDALDEDGRRRLERVAVNAVYMGDLVDDLLEYFRAGRRALHMTEFDMTGLVTEVLAELREQQPERVVNVKLGRLADAPADLAAIREVWVNLLSNAYKFTAPRDEARIDIDCRREKDQVTYRVQDNGVGFDMAYGDKLFGVFERLHGDEFAGTGIGLALVSRIVARHEGRVSAEGAEGVGATFSFTLPASQSRTEEVRR